MAIRGTGTAERLWGLQSDAVEDRAPCIIVIASTTERGNGEVTRRSATTRNGWPACRLAAAFGLTIGLLTSQGLAEDAEDARPPDRVSFYFAAHEDDWQLFMNPSAFMDVSDPNTKTVFIHVTAGDAGVGKGTGGRKHPYYLARENGAEVAIRFMADAGERPVEKVVSAPILNGHRLYSVSYR